MNSEVGLNAREYTGLELLKWYICQEENPNMFLT